MVSWNFMLTKGFGLLSTYLITAGASFGLITTQAQGTVPPSSNNSVYVVGYCTARVPLMKWCVWFEYLQTQCYHIQWQLRQSMSSNNVLSWVAGRKWLVVIDVLEHCLQWHLLETRSTYVPMGFRCASSKARGLRSLQKWKPLLPSP